MSTGKLSQYVQRAVREPDVWLRATCCLLIAWTLVHLLLFSFGRDQSIYAEVADGILRGELPYRDRWDFKPPGVFLVYALAQALFGKVMWGVRLLEAGGVVLMSWSMIRLSKTFFADDRPGYVGAAIAALLHVQMEFWHSGQPESFGGFLTMFGLWLATLRSSDGKRQLLLWLACGAVFGLAFLQKPPLGGAALVCAAYIARERWLLGGGYRRVLSPFLTLGFGSVVPIGLVLGWFALSGAWPALSWTLFEFTPGYTKLGWSRDAEGAFYLALEYAFAKYSALTAVGAVAAAVGSPLSSREREGLALFLGVIAIHLAGIAMQAKFFEYHFDATLPLVSFLAGLGWFKIWRKAMTRGVAGAVAFASLAVVAASARLPVYDVPHGFWERCGKRFDYLLGFGGNHTRADLDRDLYYVADFSLAADRDVARRVTELTEPDDVIFVWGFEPAIYWLSDRPPASRFIYNVPQRAQWEREYARTELLSDLEERSPEVFIVQHNDYFNFVTGDDLDSFRALATFPELEELLRSRYEHVEKLEDFEVYVRRR